MTNHLYLYLIYLIFALTPAAIWMYFYFKKDLHPEPKKMILKVFILGILAACFAAIFEIIILGIIPGKSLLIIILESFLLVALVEELLKYLVVRIYVFNSPELDEPLDVMFYMVVSALGFATLENIVLFFGANHPYTVGAAFSFALLRFLGAVFLHTLTSGTLGFFIAMSFCSAKNKKLLLFLGFFIAVVFHGFYNIAVVELAGFTLYSVLATIIIILAIFTTFAFIKLRKMKSICKISAK
jgi:RsiW-degrading membrane proteinase PrsW (M82 family)